MQEKNERELLEKRYADQLARNREALELYGPQHVLAALANLPAPEAADAVTRAAEFSEMYGPLFPDMEPADTLEYAKGFRLAWGVKTEREARALNKLLENWFTTAIPGLPDDSNLAPLKRPAIRADFLRGRWEPVRRTLLDALAIELMRSRKNLYRCERPDCRRYFLKAFSRDRYCQRLCSEEMRRRGQEKYLNDNREEINRRRRKHHAKRNSRKD